MDNDNSALITDLSTPIFQAKGWMKFVGVLMIIYGVLIALSIVGIIIAWIPIWMGVLLFQAASSAEQANINNDQAALFTSMTRLKTYFTIMGILLLLSIVMTVLAFAFGVGGAILAGAGGGAF